MTGATYTYYTNKLGAYDSFLYVYITLQEVRDDVSVKVNVEQKNNDFAFKIEEGYSIYIDDTLVTGEVGETVLVNVTFKSVLMLVPDDGFIFICVNGDSRIVFYQMANGVSTLYQNYALSVASDNSYAYFEFSNFYTLQYGKVAIDSSKHVEFLDVMLASHKADNVTQYCASANDLNNITFPDGKPVGVNTDNSLTFSVKLPFGNYPVLFVEYANRLSDGYYTYQAVSSSQEGDYSIFTFEVTNIDSDVNWFLELRPNVYEVTVHYGDKTDTVTLTHGQILADCDALLSSFEGSFEGQNGLFKVVGWSSEEGGDANVILVAGPDNLWAVAEFVPYTVSFEGQGFTSLSEALKALDQNASGTLDVLWGSAQELKAGEYSIPSGVTLRLPYAQNSYGRKLAETTDAPSIFYADDAKGTVMLKVAEGGKLFVNGTLEIRGRLGADVACEVKGAKILVYAPNSNLKVTSREAVHFDKGVFTVTYEQTSSATVNGSTNLQYGKVYTSGEGGVWA